MKIRIIKVPKHYKCGGDLDTANARKWNALGGPLGNAIRTPQDSLVPSYNRAVYSSVDPKSGIPPFHKAVQAAIGAKGKSIFGDPNEMEYSVGTQLGDSVADAAWRKRLGLSYDDKFLPVFNGDTVRLPKQLELEIPTDTTKLKDRIANTERLMKYSPKYKNSNAVNVALEADKEALKALRDTYKTGKTKGINEYSYNSRKLVKDGIIDEENISPLNVFRNYNIRYDKDSDSMYYSKSYDFNTKEGNNWDNFVPGDKFYIRGNIPLNKKSLGGSLNSHGGIFDNGVMIINSGGSHEENPFGGIQIGVDNEGTPNLVEEGEVIYNDYVFSDRIKIPDEIRKEYKLKGKTFARAAKSAQRESSERPNDPLSKAGLEAAMERIASAQEEVKSKKEAYREGNKYPSMFASGGKKQTFTRYAPIIGSGVASLTDIFNKPDYGDINTIGDVDLSAEIVGYTPVGNYLSYNPLDRDFYINKLNQQTAATRRGLVNTSGGNRASAQAGLLASDYNYGQNIGNLARQAEEYNQQLRERVEAFNRGTNMFNTETGLKAGMFNAESKNAAKRARLGQATTVAQMRQAIKDQDIARRSANITNFLQGLGDMGWENEQRNWLDELAKSGVLKMNTKGEYTGGTKAKGGKIKTRKKKGLTYG